MYQVKFTDDEDAALENPHGSPLPGPREEYEGHEVYQHGVPISYETYCRTSGDPDNHRVLGVRVRRICACCGQGDPRHEAALWNVDTLIGDPEARVPLDVWLSADDPQIIGYLRQVVDALIADLP